MAKTHNAPSRRVPQVVVISVEEYGRLKGERSGQELVDLMQASPLRDVMIDHESTRAPVREVEP